MVNFQASILPVHIEYLGVYVFMLIGIGHVLIHRGLCVSLLACILGSAHQGCACLICHEVCLQLVSNGYLNVIRLSDLFYFVAHQGSDR